MGAKIVTGYTGNPHVTSADDGALNAGTFGTGRYVLPVGNKFEHEVISNNLIKIKDGYALNQGRLVGIPSGEYEEVTIDNGLQGVKRSDLIVFRYEKNNDSGIESATIIVLKGTSGDEYKDPVHEEGNILEGAGSDDLVLYRVNINGINIESVDKLFDESKSLDNTVVELVSLINSVDEKYTKEVESINGNIGEIETNVSELNSNLDTKQDKLTNPLTKSDVVNNLTSKVTNVPLSAYQGKVLNDKAVKYKRINMGQITLQAGTAVNKSVSINLPSGSNVISVYVTSGTYYAWFSSGIGTSSNESVLLLGLANHYTESLTDTFVCVIAYI